MEKETIKPSTQNTTLNPNNEQTDQRVQLLEMQLMHLEERIKGMEETLTTLSHLAKVAQNPSVIQGWYRNILIGATSGIKMGL